MNLLHDLIKVITSGLNEVSGKQLTLYIVLAVIFSIACVFICSYYTRLWNKAFQATLTHWILSIVAAFFTFFFVLAFFGFLNFQKTVLKMVDFWGDSITHNAQWSHDIFRQAYDNVKAKGEEDFSSNPVPIPCSKDGTKKYLANFYTAEVCKNFDTEHKFLSKLIWPKGGIAPEKAEKDMTDFFSKNPNQQYDLNNTVSLVTNDIKDDLKSQTPRIVTIAIILLVLAFILIQAIPFGLIGWAAYKDLHKNIQYSRSK